MENPKCVNCGTEVEAVKFRGRVSEKNRSMVHLRLFGKISRTDFDAYFCRRCTMSILGFGLERAVKVMASQHKTLLESVIENNDE